MKPNQTKQVFKIEGMTCVSCENRIKRQLEKLQGMAQVEVSYSTGIAECLYDKALISEEHISKQVEKAGYLVKSFQEDKVNKTKETTKILTILVGILFVYNVMKYFGLTNVFYMFPEAKENMTYSMLFVIGLLTSIHCIAMCGGINLSQCMSYQSKGKESKLAALRPSFLYNLGRVISYTIFGGIVGGIGSAVSFTGESQGFIQMVAGIFMVIMGLNMLNIFPWMRRLNPRMPRIFSKQTMRLRRNRSPFYVGLLNGLIPCGPLQAMQLYALSTGSMVKGAFAMFLFSLGTVPLMFGMGALSSILSKKFTSKIMSIGAVLVVILGISMFNSGTSLAGIAPSGIASTGSSHSKVQGDIQVVETSLAPGSYASITVKAGIPVKWRMTAEKGSINGCNNRIFIPEYGIEKKFSLGENIIEFTPTEEGIFMYSCWMGMIRSTIIVTK